MPIMKTLPLGGLAFQKQMHALEIRSWREALAKSHLMERCLWVLYDQIGLLAFGRFKASLQVILQIFWGSLLYHLKLAGNNPIR